MASEAGMRSTTAGNCCPQQQSRWLSDPSRRLAAASPTPANGCRRPHDTPGAKNEGPVRKQRERVRKCSFVWYFRSSPANARSPEEFRPTVSVHASVRPSKHQRWRYCDNKTPVLDRTEGLDGAQGGFFRFHGHIRSWQNLNTALCSLITGSINAMRSSSKTFSQYSHRAWTSIFSDNKKHPVVAIFHVSIRCISRRLFKSDEKGSRDDEPLCKNSDFLFFFTVAGMELSIAEED